LSAVKLSGSLDVHLTCRDVARSLADKLHEAPVKRIERSRVWGD